MKNILIGGGVNIDNSSTDNRNGGKESVRHKIRKPVFRFSAFYLALITCVTYLPIIVVVVYSFNESRISSVWDGFSLRWYSELFADRDMISSLMTSVILAAFSSLIAALIATLGAIGIQRTFLPMRRTVEYISSLPIMIPEIVLGMVFLVFFTLIGFKLGFPTLLIAHTSFAIPYIYMQVKARLVGMDSSCVDAARDLGASGIRAFFDVTLPMITPALISGMFISFAMSFDDVIISIFVTGVNTSTLPIKVYTQLKTGTTPKINALCTLMLAVTILCYIIAGIIARRAKRTMPKKSAYISGIADRVKGDSDN